MCLLGGAFGCSILQGHGLQLHVSTRNAGFLASRPKVWLLLAAGSALGTEAWFSAVAIYKFEPPFLPDSIPMPSRIPS